ncbi:hypothetical protein [Pseudomonas prosekii]|uniref:hypothetical protein n=1 Tax=Pseudomonas prosekii TaxID=1148509 RepID=UPI00387B492D
MTSLNDANYVKWLLVDAMMDLVAAVDMARETIAKFDPGAPSKAIGRLRVCNHSIIISLSKLTEIKEGYSRFFKALPPDVTANFYRDVAVIESKNIYLFRNKHAAHILDRDTKAPISLVRGDELLSTITGKDNSECLSFYDWVYPESWAIENECVVSTVVAMRDYCKGLPGGELERP